MFPGKRLVSDACEKSLGSTKVIKGTLGLPWRLRGKASTFAGDVGSSPVCPSTAAAEPVIEHPGPATPEARVPQGLSSAAREATTLRSLHTAAREELSKNGDPRVNKK